MELRMDNVLRSVFIVTVICISFALSPASNAALRFDEWGDAKKAFQNGQNDEALRLLVIKLRKDNDHQDAIKLFKTVLKLVVDKHQTAAEDCEASRDWACAIREYDILRKISSDLSSVSPLEKVKVNGKDVKQPVEMPKIDVRAQRSVAIGNAAEAHYQKGVTYANTAGSSEMAATEFDTALRYVPDYKDSRQLAAEGLYRDGAAAARIAGSSDRAVTLFDAALRYVPDYKDSRQLAAESLYRDGVGLIAKKDFKGATLKLRRVDSYVPGYKDAVILSQKAKQSAIQRVAVMPFNNLSGKAQFGDVGQIMTDRIISETMNSNSEFLEFVTREYVTELLKEQAFGQTTQINESTAAKVGKLTGIHAFVFGKVLSITASYPAEQVEQGRSTQVLCSVITLFGICPQGSAVQVGVIWQKHTLQGFVEIGGSFQIVSVEKGTIVKTETINKRLQDRAQWVTFTSGDERAIPAEIRAYDTGQRPIEPAEQLAQKAIEDISKGLATNLAQFFR